MSATEKDWRSELKRIPPHVVPGRVRVERVWVRGELVRFTREPCGLDYCGVYRCVGCGKFRRWCCGGDPDVRCDYCVVKEAS